MSESDAKSNLNKNKISGQHTPIETTNNNDLKAVIKENSNRQHATPDLFYQKNVSLMNNDIYSNRF